MTNAFVFKNALLLDGETAQRGSLVVQNGKIKQIAQADQALDLDPGTQIFECRGSILMPALFNAHTHAAMVLFRGMGSGLNLQRWLNEVIFPIEERLTADMCYLATWQAALESLRFGVVGMTDMYYHMNRACDAVLEAGMRFAAVWSSSVENQRSLYQDYNGQDERIRVFAGIHAEYTSTIELIEEISDFSHTYRLPMHLHLSETKSEHEACIKRHGVTPAALFDRYGVFDFGGSAAHCCYLEPGDVEILRGHQVTAVYNPISNLKLASGFMPLKDYLESGLTVALGTDGCASNNNLNLFEEMRFAALLEKGRRLDPVAITPREVFKMATEYGARACGFPNSGMLKPGAEADLIVVNTQVAHAQPLGDPYAHLAYSAQGSDVRLTMCAGKVLYLDGHYPQVDAPRITNEFNRQVAGILR